MGSVSAASSNLGLIDAVGSVSKFIAAVDRSAAVTWEFDSAADAPLATNKEATNRTGLALNAFQNRVDIIIHNPHT
jgi:hypothetical protein